MKTRMHHYAFDLTVFGAQEAYDHLAASLAADPGRGVKWAVAPTADFDHSDDGAMIPVEVEIAELFDNQWNTADYRVFDWYEEVGPSSRRGYWLEITPEMAAVRRDTQKCRRCSAYYGPHHQPMPTPLGGPKRSLLVCPRCVASPHLKPADYRQARLVPVSYGMIRELAEITQAESEIIAQAQAAAQTRADKYDGRPELTAQLAAEYDRKVSEAARERDGKTWLVMNGVPLDNVLYLAHTGRFSFGWMSPITPAVRARLVPALADFPFEYDLIAAEGAAT